MSPKKKGYILLPDTIATPRRKGEEHAVAEEQLLATGLEPALRAEGRGIGPPDLGVVVEGVEGGEEVGLFPVNSVQARKEARLKKERRKGGD